MRVCNHSLLWRACPVLVTLSIGVPLFGQSTQSSPPDAAGDSSRKAFSSSSNRSAGAALQAATAGEHGKYGPIELLTDPQGVDFHPYVSDLFSKVRSSWYALLPPDAYTKKGKLAIEFTIIKDGSLKAMKLVGSSGNTSLDRAAWDGIKAAAPFASLPSAFKGDYIALRCIFWYNPSANELAESKNPPGLGDSVKRAVLIQSVADANIPKYPANALEAKVDGIVRLEATVGTDGEVKDVLVLEGDPLLAEASTRAVRRWLFNPAMINDARAEDKVRIKVEFRLEGERVRAEVVSPQQASENIP